MDKHYSIISKIFIILWVLSYIWTINSELYYWVLVISKIMFIIWCSFYAKTKKLHPILGVLWMLSILWVVIIYFIGKRKINNMNEVNHLSDTKFIYNSSNMPQYFFKLLFVLAISFSVIGKYYTQKNHLETADGYVSYLIFLIVSYVWYKAFFLMTSKDKVRFSPAILTWFALFNILWLSIWFFDMTWQAQNGGLILFFKIIWYLFLPSLISLIAYWAWHKTLKYIKSFEWENVTFKFLMSLWTWFTIYITLLSILSFFWLFNISGLLSILLIMTWYSYKEIWQAMLSFFNRNITFDNHDLDWNFLDTINLRLISAEFSFLILTFLIWINFINIVRPMPIWWDDLWVYMNYPQIIANSWKAIAWVWLIAWQIFTWVGFMFHNATQAFFLNQVWWILSIVVLVMVFKEFFNDWKKRFLSIPIILATMFYAMPMIIFQQAKDMKLDPGLFFVTIIWIYWIYHLFAKYLWYKDSNDAESFISAFDDIAVDGDIKKSPSFTHIQNNWLSDMFEKKDTLIYIFVIWAILWLAFAIKVTTLMVILWLLWVIFYAKLWFFGFLWYFAAFLGVFTKFSLWTQLNISYPKDDTRWLLIFSIICISLSIGFFVISIQKYTIESFKKTFLITLILLSWTFVTLFPWFVKNISEAGSEPINIGVLLSWKGNWFVPDYTKIHTPQELKDIESKSTMEAISDEWKASNEDLWRYFGYENWINNYMKLPWNLTFQLNQNWEYTEITYFFLALLPAILVFLTYRRREDYLWVIAMTLLSFLYFYWYLWINDLFSELKLPFWYLFIVGFYLLAMIYFIFTLAYDKISQIARMNFIFSFVYGILFIVAAYWIVWYWIAVYFWFLLFIWAALANISVQNWNDNEDTSRIFWSFVMFLAIFSYFVMSSFPHWINNLKAAWFTEYKAWLVNQEEGIFGSHPDYFLLLSHLNLKDSKAFAKKLTSEITSTNINKFIESTLKDDYDTAKLAALMKELISADLNRFNFDQMTQYQIKADAKEILNKIYSEVLYPSKENQNKDIIYRIWTFLTYFISENRTRYYDDSLVQSYWKYIYDKDPDKTVENMKKLWLKFLLVDLNAATIDKDPRHDLTKRFESLLESFRSKNLELINTDSLCLRLALEENNDKFLETAWVNYESYTASWQVIQRQQKQIICYNHILELLKDNKVNDKNYSYLIPIWDYIKKNNITSQDQMFQLMQQAVWHWWLALFRIK